MHNIDEKRQRQMLACARAVANVSVMPVSFFSSVPFPRLISLPMEELFCGAFPEKTSSAYQNQTNPPIKEPPDEEESPEPPQHPNPTKAPPAEVPPPDPQKTPPAPPISAG